MPDHTDFIVAAYAVTGIVLAGVVAAILHDHRAQRRALARLTAQIDQRAALPKRATQGRSDDKP